jgi:hypothetical protein
MQFAGGKMNDNAQINELCFSLQRSEIFVENNKFKKRFQRSRIVILIIFTSFPKSSLGTELT